MKLFEKNNTTEVKPVIHIVNPVVVPVGSIVVLDGRPFRSESYGLVEVTIQELPKEELVADENTQQA